MLKGTLAMVNRSGIELATLQSLTSRPWLKHHPEAPLVNWNSESVIQNKGFAVFLVHTLVGEPEECEKKYLYIEKFTFNLLAELMLSENMTKLLYFFEVFEV